jgi:hypothetical protein
MLWVPERESYLIQIPKFLTFWGFFSWIWRLSVSRPPCPLFVCTHLVYGDDLTVGLLDLAELAKEVPEPRLGDNLVGRKDAHAVDLGGRVGI